MSTAVNQLRGTSIKKPETWEGASRSLGDVFLPGIRAEVEVEAG